MFNGHSSELMAIKQFSVKPHSLLHEKRRPSRHLFFTRMATINSTGHKKHKPMKETNLSNIHFNIIYVVLCLCYFYNSFQPDFSFLNYNDEYQIPLFLIIFAVLIFIWFLTLSALFIVSVYHTNFAWYSTIIFQYLRFELSGRIT